jgi:hypothetical protein
MDELKKEFRRLALENHPDQGGNPDIMREIIAEFDMAFSITKRRFPKSGAADTETAAAFRKTFYTQSGWAGSRYNRDLTLREIAPIVRGYVKDVYPTYKFSVQTEYFSGGCAIRVALMEAPEFIFSDERIRDSAIASSAARYYKSDEEAVRRSLERSKEGHLQNWPGYCDWMTDKTKAVLEDVEALVNSYNYNDSDSMIDYFDVNFYTSFNIGKGDRPLKIVPKEERLQSAKVSKGAKRLTA